MSLDVNWTITPTELLNQLGWQFKRRGEWYVLPICPFCHGGNGRDRQTFIVHSTEGHYACLRASCDEKGTFWGLLLSIGENPKEYLGERLTREKKKGYVYGR